MYSTVRVKTPNQGNRTTTGILHVRVLLYSRDHVLLIKATHTAFFRGNLWSTREFALGKNGETGKFLGRYLCLSDQNGIQIPS